MTQYRSFREAAKRKMQHWATPNKTDKSIIEKAGTKGGSNQGTPLKTQKKKFG